MALSEREFALLESTVREICIVRAAKNGDLDVTRVMDGIDWGDLGQQAERQGFSSEFVKKTLTPTIAIAELKAQGKLPS